MMYKMSPAEVAVLFFFYVLFYGTPISFIVFCVCRHYRLRKWIRNGEFLPAIAEALGGEVARDPSFDVPFVRLKVGGARAYFFRWLLTGSPFEKIASAIEIRMGSPGFFEATSRRSRRFPSRCSCVREVRPFHEYHFVSSEPSWAGRLLDDGLETFLLDLERMFRKPIRLQLTPGRIILDVESALAPKAAAALVREAGRLVGLLRGAGDSAGIQIVDEAFDPSASSCPVCRLKAAESMVVCLACRAPHHADCWSYTGRCAILGCGSQRVA